MNAHRYRVVLAHKIRLRPNREQERYFCCACGVARFAYNWALAESEAAFALGERLSEAALRRKLNALKDSQFPWMREVTKNAPQQAIRNLGRAYANYFAAVRMAREGAFPYRLARKPTFKRKGRRDSFRADSGPERSRPSGVRTDGRKIKLPRIGWVRMREALRFDGRILSVTISRQADRWYAAVAVEVFHCVPKRSDTRVAGCDLGITTFATIADERECRKIVAPKPLHRLAGRLRRLDKSLSRKVAGSHNWRKAKAKLARLHARISDIRIDALHKLTTSLVRNFGVLGIEDINVGGIHRNRHLAFALSDLAFGEFRRQLVYKAGMQGGTLVIADRWFPSSKICSACSSKNGDLRFGVARWVCPRCKTEHDRDENAARNLFHAASSAVSACGAKGLWPGVRRAKPVAKKQEDLQKQIGTVRRSLVHGRA